MPDDAEGEPPASLSCHDLSVDVGRWRLLHGVSLSVARGAWLGIVGPNGAGKSTLLRAFAGLVRSSGSVVLEGHEASSLDGRTRARLVALVPQLPVVPPGMTVWEYVLLGRTPHLPPMGAERRADLDAAAEALGWLDLEAFASRPLDTLSGGERQRVLVGRALAQGASILLLDEPTTSLDVGHQQDVLELVDRLRRTRCLTVVSTMHDLTLAGQYSESLVLLDRGRIVAAGAVDEVLTEANLGRYYGARVRVMRNGPGVVVVPCRGEDQGPGPTPPATASEACPRAVAGESPEDDQGQGDDQGPLQALDEEADAAEEQCQHQ